MFFTFLLFVTSSFACEACRKWIESQRRFLKSADFDADELSNFLPTNRRHDPWILYADPDELENRRINLHEITKIADQINKIGGILGYDAEDADDKFKLKFNPKEITKIAGQVAQIGGILGFDAEDADDEIATICAVIGAACALASTGANIYSHVKGEDEAEALEFDAEDADDKKINLDEIEKIANKTQQIIEILKSDDVENGLGKKLRKLGRRIKRNIRRELPKVTQIAGKVAQIGQVLGYDAEDLEDGEYDAMIDVACKIINTVCKVADTGFKVHDTAKKHRGADSVELLSYDAEDVDDIAVTTACAIIGAACALANTGLNIYDHVKGDDEVEDLEDIFYPTTVQTGGRVIHYDVDEIENKVAGGCTMPFRHRRPIRKYIKKTD